jgi:hypothetical protein
MVSPLTQGGNNALRLVALLPQQIHGLSAVNGNGRVTSIAPDLR